MLAGRTAERDRLVGLLADAAAGRGAALVLHGLPGAGKSALLEELVACAGALDPPARVLRTAGIESESPLAFAALQRLLRPALPLCDRLPDPQSQALRGAFGETDVVGDRFVVFLATLSLLAELATEQPVLAVVDDAHWLDEASAAALQFVARRLDAERVALVFGARDGDVRQFDAGDLPGVLVEGLDDVGTAQLLSARAGVPVPAGVASRLREQTGGNPLALVEITDALGPDELTGAAPLPAVLPLTDGVEAAFLSRYRELSEPARTWLLLAAADDSGLEGIVTAAAASVGAEGDDVVADVEASGLARIRNGHVYLRHPLVRSAVYGAATSGERRRAHRSLADALAAGGDADRRAWHLAAAADRPDDGVVAALDAVAQRAAARAGHEAATAAWTRAAELTADGAERGRRLFQAAASAWYSGHPARAATLAGTAAAEDLEPRVRVRLLTLQGQIEWNTRSLDAGYDLVLQAAETSAPLNQRMAQQLAMLATSLAAFGARSPRHFDPVTLVPEPDAGAAVEQWTSYDLLHGFDALARRNYDVAAQRFTSAFARADAHGAGDDQVLQPNLAIAAWLIDDDERNTRMHEQQLTASRRAGALNMVEHALTRGFTAQIATGAWSKAAAAATEALSLTGGTGHPGLTALPLAELALIAALRGDPEADSRLDEVSAIIEAHPIGITEVLVIGFTQWARALRLADQPETALHHVERIALPALRRLATLDVVDAAFRANRPEVAAVWLAEMEHFAHGTRSPTATAIVEHGRALFAADGDAEAHFERSLAAHARSPRMPDRARTHLAYGEHLRRERRRVDARAQLRSALALFEDLGATPSAERAAQELRASGETARRRDVTTAEQLTAQETQVAGLVRQGLSNRDVAAALFVSPRTVDFHLRNVYRKLGLSSRSELIALPLDV